MGDAFVLKTTSILFIFAFHRQFFDEIEYKRQRKPHGNGDHEVKYHGENEGQNEHGHVGFRRGLAHLAEFFVFAHVKGDHK